MTELALLAGLLGGAFGLLADRLSVRWPEHEPGVQPRRPDWRTAVVMIAGAAIAAGLVLRWQDPRDIAVLAIYCAALLVLLATDLDQRMLPDLITLPLIGYCALVLVLGWSPLLADDPIALASGLAAGLGAPLFLLVTDFLLKGALGFGDLKLAAALGFMSGVARFFSGLVLAGLAIALLLIVLILARRLGRRSLMPFGPILIGGGFIAVLMP